MSPGRNAVASDLVGRAVKRSISFDPELLAAAEREARHAEYRGNLSALINDALERTLKSRRGLRLLAEIEREAGPVPEEVKAEVDREWREWHSR